MVINDAIEYMCFLLDSSGFELEAYGVAIFAVQSKDAQTRVFHSTASHSGAVFSLKTFGTMGWSGLLVL